MEPRSRLPTSGAAASAHDAAQRSEQGAFDCSKGEWRVLIDSVQAAFAKITLHELKGLYFDQRMFKANQKQ